MIMKLMRRENRDYPAFQNCFEDFFGPVHCYPNNAAKVWVPAVNVAEDENQFQIEFATPGFIKSDFSINMDNDVLTVKSVKNNAINDCKSNYTRREFSYSSFERSFTLPEIADGEKIKASYKDGILSIEIPKKKEIKSVKEIEIS